ncbi:solute carrier family 2, facilitated glucose transporter member 3 isoform X4 [Calliopsis andreniformis]|uniref:solute carrier family 2, facilitated glucose transporter member 3 isoform X4 n=1 Tax=Calliopsis andreniformis TaxID=337506 RepID=UPI003FCE6DE7
MGDMLEYKDSHAAVLSDVERPHQPSDDRDERLAPGGWTITLALAGVTCCLGSAVPAGFNIGVLNNAAHLVGAFCNESIKERYHVDVSESNLKILWSTVVSIFLIGGVTGSYLSSWLADRYGRKKTLCIGNIFGIVGAAMFFLVQKLNSIELLLAGRLVVELSRIRNMDIMLLQVEIANLQHEIETKTTAEPWTLKRILKDPSLKLPLFLVCLIQFGQQMSGINVVFYYSNSIFLAAGLGLTGSQYATLGTGVANIAMALVSVSVMSSLNRRIVLLTSNYLCLGCLIVLCISILIIHFSSIMPIVCIVAVMAYVIFYGIGLGPIPYFIGSELFDVGPRPIAMALGSVFNWGGNFIVGMMFPIVESIIGAYTFLIFAGFLLFLGQIVRIYLPETRGRSTMDVAASVSQGFQSRPNSRHVA